MATLSTDPLLSAVAGFPQQPLLLTEKDVAALLQCSVRLLQQWRAEGVSPPTWMALGPKLIRYPADALVAWVRSGVGTSKAPRGLAARTIAPVGDGLFAPDWAAAGFDEPPFRGGRKPKIRHASFMSFLSSALPDEEWLFVVQARTGRPIEFIESLGEERSDADEVQWLQLYEYLAAVKRAAELAASQIVTRELEQVLPKSGMRGKEPL